jgi:hypothetical protein
LACCFPCSGCHCRHHFSLIFDVIFDAIFDDFSLQTIFQNPNKLCLKIGFLYKMYKI